MSKATFTHSSSALCRQKRLTYVSRKSKHLAGVSGWQAQSYSEYDYRNISCNTENLHLFTRTNHEHHGLCCTAIPCWVAPCFYNMARSLVGTVLMWNVAAITLQTHVEGQQGVAVGRGLTSRQQYLRKIHIRNEEATRALRKPHEKMLLLFFSALIYWGLSNEVGYDRQCLEHKCWQLKVHIEF
jgi:hypothetical protein